MININRFRMTASEIAMGRYMRAPDHDAGTAAFDTAFAEFASPEDKKPDAAAASGDGGAAASGGAGDGQGASGDSGGGSGGADAGAGDGGAGDGSGGAASGSGDGAAAAAAGGDQGATGGDQGAGASGSDAGAGGDAGAAAGADVGAGAADAGAAAKPGDAAGDAGAAAAAGAAAGGAAAAPDADAILAGLKKLVGQTEEAPAAAGGDGAAAGGEQPKPIYSDDETAFLKKYEEDWGDVSRGEALKRRAEYQQLLQHVFAQVANFVKPIQETAEVLAERTFSTDLRSAVPDYSNQLRDEVTAWVKTQPTYLQVAYNHVITEGTVDEVKDLVERYRTATGKAAPKPAGAGAAEPKPADKGNELSDEAKKAAAALAPVDSKRSGVSAPSDPSNFDDAWKQASADLG